MNLVDGLTVRNLSVRNEPRDRNILSDFLRENGLGFEEDIDYTISFFKDERICATASLAGNVIKCVAVDSGLRGENLTSRLVTYIKLHAHHNGINSLFVYTSPENSQTFKSLGFFEISSTENAVLLEDNSRMLRNYIEELNELQIKGKQNACIVMNCNPFTLGHRHLIEKAALENENLIVFVVEEDLSVFPFSIRFKLVKEGTADISNVTVVPAGRYIISQATFPSYFLKDAGNVNETHARLDIGLFAEHIAPAAGITSRYIGEEPFCPVTRMYNRIMNEVLPAAGIGVKIIPRYTASGKAVSASEVRRKLAAGDMPGVKNLVPDTTYNFLISEDAESLIALLMENGNENS